ncbi:unnamed protein product [Nezara viridula]|uniref:Odorant receptor n=1 Tax=Nezara viridula TaxID=85310 RepID=A0A9P0HMW9_NEZVI|nr:unnamed protein product [Nezara viridula]
MFLLTTPSYALIVFTRNLTLEPEEREFVFKLWDPLQYFLDKEYYYFSRLVYEVTLFTYALFTIGSVYLVYFVPCFMAAAQMKFLMKMLSSKHLDVTVCIKFHQKILRFVRNINSLFSGQMFFEIVLSALPITFRSYQLIMMLTNYDPRAVGVFFFLILCFLVPLLVCFSGQMISDASEDLFIGTYQNEWYRLNVQERKSLCIMMTIASIPLNLCYRNTMTFNMDRYMTVVQATYSYITVLINYN